MPSKKYLIIFMIISLIPIIATVILYPNLPDIIPTHFNSKGIADVFGRKSSIWISTIIVLICDYIILGAAIISVKLSKKMSMLEMKFTYKTVMILNVYMNIIGMMILYVTVNYNQSSQLNISEITIIGSIFICIYAVVESIRVKRKEKALRG